MRVIIKERVIVTPKFDVGVVFWSSRKMTIKPKGKKNVLEFIYEFVNSTISQNLGKFTKNYSLLLFVIFQDFEKWYCSQIHR